MHARHVGRLGRVVRLSGTTTHKTPIWLQSLWNRGIAGGIKNQETLHTSGVLAGLATAVLDSNSWNPHSVFLLALFAYCCYCCCCLPAPFMYMQIKLLMDCVTSFLSFLRWKVKSLLKICSTIFCKCTQCNWSWCLDHKWNRWIYQPWFLKAAQLFHSVITSSLTNSSVASPSRQMLSLCHLGFMVIRTRINIMSVKWTIRLQWLLWLYILEICSVIDKQECRCALLRLSEQAPIASVTPATALGLPACNFMAQKYTMSHSVNIHSWWRLAHLPPVSSTRPPFFS